MPNGKRRSAFWFPQALRPHKDPASVGGWIFVGTAAGGAIWTILQTVGVLAFVVEVGPGVG